MVFRRKRKRRRSADTPRRVLFKQIAIGVGLLVFIALIGYGVWYGTRLDALTIDTVTVSGGKTIAHDTVRGTINAALSGSYFKLVPYRFVWTYPKEDIYAAVATNPRIDDITLTRDGTELHVAFTEYTPHALWCSSVTDSARCLFLDRSGYAFAPAPQLVGTTLVRYSDRVHEPMVGEHAYTASTSARFAQFVRTVEDRYNLPIFHIEQIAPDEVVYHIIGGSKLKVSQRMDLQKTIENLGTILSSREFRHLEAGNFAYIDLRYGERVFVNEKGAATTTASSSVTSTTTISNE